MASSAVARGKASKKDSPTSGLLPLVAAQVLTLDNGELINVGYSIFSCIDVLIIISSSVSTRSQLVR